MELDFQRRHKLNVSSLQINAEIVHFLLRHLQTKTENHARASKPKGLVRSLEPVFVGGSCNFQMFYRTLH